MSYPMTPEHKAAIIAGGQAPWECPHCHKAMKKVSSGWHTANCHLNPDRLEERQRRARGARTQVVCEFCGKKMLKASLRHHINDQCPVARGIREGRLTYHKKDETFNANEVTVTGEASTLASTFVKVDVVPPVIDIVLVDDVLNLAVQQLVEGYRPTVLMWTNIITAKQTLSEAIIAACS